MVQVFVVIVLLVFNESIVRQLRAKRKLLHSLSIEIGSSELLEPEILAPL
jgi:hypothetical protein